MTRITFAFGFPVSGARVRRVTLFALGLPTSASGPDRRVCAAAEGSVDSHSAGHPGGRPRGRLRRC